MTVLPIRVFLLAALLAAGSAQAQLKLPGGPAQGLAPPTLEAAEPPATREAANEKEAAGQQAAAGWLFLLDRRDWGRAWDTSAAMFRAAVPIGAWMDGIPKVRAPLGNLLERQPTEMAYKTTLAGKPDGEYVTVIFQSKFDGKPDLQDVVTTVLEADGRWRVTGYSTR